MTLATDRFPNTSRANTGDLTDRSGPVTFREHLNDIPEEIFDNRNSLTERGPFNIQKIGLFVKNENASEANGEEKKKTPQQSNSKDNKVIKPLRIDSSPKKLRLDSETNSDGSQPSQHLKPAENKQDSNTYIPYKGELEASLAKSTSNPYLKQAVEHLQRETNNDYSPNYPN